MPCGPRLSQTVPAYPTACSLLVRPLPGAPSQPQLVLLDHGLYRALPQGLRMDYTRLWQAIISSDEAGIRKYSARMQAGDLYQLWSGMLTQRTWDRIMEARDDVDSLRVSDSECSEQSL